MGLVEAVQAAGSKLVVLDGDGGPAVSGAGDAAGGHQLEGDPGGELGGPGQGDFDALADQERSLGGEQDAVGTDVDAGAGAGFTTAGRGSPAAGDDSYSAARSSGPNLEQHEPSPSGFAAAL